jgi:ubiquinone/menaquinone biosynthesis C-methylase UbiE
VDIAESMIEKAREFNRHGDRVEYRVNTVDELKILESDSFDFVYTNITLQHIPPEAAGNYIREFFRVLRPGGVAIFQVPSGTPYKPGSLRARLYNLRRLYLRRAWKLVRRMPPVEIHYVPRRRVERIVQESAARLVDVVRVGKSSRRGENFRYCATKPGLPG